MMILIIYIINFIIFLYLYFPLFMNNIYKNNIIKLLDKSDNKLLRWTLSLNINAIPILEKNYDKIDWHMLSNNTNAMKILEIN